MNRAGLVIALILVLSNIAATLETDCLFSTDAAESEQDDNGLLCSHACNTTSCQYTDSSSPSLTATLTVTLTCDAGQPKVTVVTVTSEGKIITLPQDADLLTLENRDQFDHVVHAFVHKDALTPDYTLFIAFSNVDIKPDLAVYNQRSSALAFYSRHIDTLCPAKDYEKKADKCSVNVVYERKEKISPDDDCGTVQFSHDREQLYMHIDDNSCTHSEEVTVTFYMLDDQGTRVTGAAVKVIRWASLARNQLFINPYWIMKIPRTQEQTYIRVIITLERVMRFGEERFYLNVFWTEGENTQKPSIKASIKLPNCEEDKVREEIESDNEEEETLTINDHAICLGFQSALDMSKRGRDRFTYPPEDKPYIPDISCVATDCSQARCTLQFFTDDQRTTLESMFWVDVSVPVCHAQLIEYTVLDQHEQFVSSGVISSVSTMHPEDTHANETREGIVHEWETRFDITGSVYAYDISAPYVATNLYVTPKRCWHDGNDSEMKLCEYLEDIPLIKFRMPILHCQVSTALDKDNCEQLSSLLTDESRTGNGKIVTFDLYSIKYVCETLPSCAGFVCTYTPREMFRNLFTLNNLGKPSLLTFQFDHCSKGSKVLDESGGADPGQLVVTLESSGGVPGRNACKVDALGQNCTVECNNCGYKGVQAKLDAVEDDPDAVSLSVWINGGWQYRQITEAKLRLNACQDNTVSAHCQEWHATAVSFNQPLRSQFRCDRNQFCNGISCTSIKDRAQAHVDIEFATCLDENSPRMLVTTSYDSPGGGVSNRTRASYRRMQAVHTLGDDTVMQDITLFRECLVLTLFSRGQRFQSVFPRVCPEAASRELPPCSAVDRRVMSGELAGDDIPETLAETEDDVPVIAAKALGNSHDINSSDAILAPLMVGVFVTLGIIFLLTLLSFYLSKTGRCVLMPAYPRRDPLIMSGIRADRELLHFEDQD